MADVITKHTGYSTEAYEDVSSFSSVDSYQPEPFMGPQVMEEDKSAVGESFSSSRVGSGSGSISSYKTALRGDEYPSKPKIAVGVEKPRYGGLRTGSSSLPDINRPLSYTPDGQLLPDEYNMETDTGLVNVKSLENLRKKHSRASSTLGSPHMVQDSRSIRSRQGSPNIQSKYHDSLSATLSLASSLESSKSEVLNPEKLNRAIERNKRQIEKYQRRKREKGLKGFVHRIFD